MSEKKLTKEQSEKIEAIKQEWLDAADKYLSESDNKQILDGGDTKALVQLQMEYKERIQKVLDEE